SATHLQCELSADATRRFEIVVVDRDGLASRADRSYEIAVRPDEPPTVQILQPVAAIDATPDASILIRASAQDDFHLKAFTLSLGIADQPARPDIDLLAIAQPDSAEAGRVLAAYELSIASLHVRPGDLIEYRAEARDEYERNGVPREPTRTPQMRIRIVGAAELADRFRGEFLALQSQLRALLAAQETLHDRTSGELAAIIHEAVGGSEPPPLSTPSTTTESTSDA